MSKTIIVGGGITGLSAALFLKLKNPKSKVLLLEASERLGGWIRSKRFTDGAIHELGPRTIRMNSPTINNMLKVIDNVNITDKIIPISKNDKTFQKRYIFAHNKLHLLDFSLLKPAQEPFTESFLTKVVKASVKRYSHENIFKDIPVDYFVRTRFGNEIADYVVDPIIRGIYACDSKELSMQATFRMLLQYEKTDSNVVIGALRQYLQNIFKWNEVSSEFNNPHLSKQVNDASVISFKGGLETLIDKMSEKITELNVDYNTGKSVLNIRKDQNNGKFHVQTKCDSQYCDRLIMAVPSYVASTLLTGVIKDSELLNHIQWNTVAVVVLEYKGNVLKDKGFGHLIPSWEIADVLGVIYDSCILPENNRRGAETTRFTVMMGGSWFSAIKDLNSVDLTEKAKEVLRTQLNICDELIRSTVAVHHNCIPMYGLKHVDLVSTVRETIKANNLQVRLCGNSYDGVSLSDCVQSAHNAVESFYT